MIRKAIILAFRSQGFKNNRLTTTKYIKYINIIHSMGMSFYHVVLVKFYCDVITRSHLHLINTSIDTFFTKLRVFLVEQRRRREAIDS